MNIENAGDASDARLNREAEKTLRNSQLPAKISRNEKRVRRDFWTKLKRFTARLPFARHLLAAYYCACDKKTPMRTKALLFGALAYFILPTDLIPDFLFGVGFTDDLAVLTMAIGLVRSHITEEHWEAARKAVEGLKTEQA